MNDLFQRVQEAELMLNELIEVKRLTIESYAAVLISPNIDSKDRRLTEHLMRVEHTEIEMIILIKTVLTGE